MGDREKFVWLQVYLISLVPAFMMVSLIGLMPPGADPMTGKELCFALFVWIAGQTAAYLLVLSWRAAYLSGRSKR